MTLIQLKRELRDEAANFGRVLTAPIISSNDLETVGLRMLAALERLERELNRQLGWEL